MIDLPRARRACAAGLLGLTLIGGCGHEEPAPDVTQTAGPALPPPAGMPAKPQTLLDKKDASPTDPKKAEVAPASATNKPAPAAASDAKKIDAPKAEKPKN